jgi:hypothetical protein
MLEDLLKSEAERFHEATLVHPTESKLGPLAQFPQMPHVLEYDASATSVRERIGERHVRLRAIGSVGLSLLAERTVTFHYEARRGEGGWSVYYPGHELRNEDVAALKAAVDELIALSKLSQMS